MDATLKLKAEQLASEIATEAQDASTTSTVWSKR